MRDEYDSAADALRAAGYFHWSGMHPFHKRLMFLRVVRLEETLAFYETDFDGEILCPQDTDAIEAFLLQDDHDYEFRMVLRRAFDARRCTRCGSNRHMLREEQSVCESDWGCRRRQEQLRAAS